MDEQTVKGCTQQIANVSDSVWEWTQKIVNNISISVIEENLNLDQAITGTL